MKVSLQWLQKLVDITDISPEIIGEKLTLHSCELEEIISVADNFKDIVTGKILSISDHTESDKLKKAQVDLGPHGTKQILFGSALDLLEGSIVPVALPGATLPGGIEIKERTMAGESSQGMICINSELGYKNEWLTVFPSETALGIPLSQADESFGDVLLDIDNKSLTHRPDMWGHRGFARELSALFQRPFTTRTPKVPDIQATDPYPLNIQTDFCRRFCALKMSNVSVQSSNMRTQMQLENVGVRAISNLVDITNYILLEYGQPMHVFDADKVDGTITVRHAQKGESLLALDGETYELSPEDIVIADEKKVLSIAGIMGGLESGVTEQTKNIIFESANFDAATIRRTSARLGLRSDSSMRFEKTLDPEQCHTALLSAVEKTLALIPDAEIDTALTSEYPRPYKKLVIALHPQKVRNISGIDLEDDEIIRLLESVGFVIQSQKYCLEVEVPSFRATKDIEMEEDLIEEIVRLYGLDKVPSILPSLPIHPPRKNHLRALEWQTRDFFASRGFLEAMNYSFVNEKDPDFTGISKSEYVRLKNPLSTEQSFLRTTLLSNMVGTLESELRTHKKLQYFEIGKTYKKKTEALPKEDVFLGFLIGEISKKENDLFFALKQELECFAAHHHTPFDFVPLESPSPCAHPSKQAGIFIGKKYVGQIYVLHPSKNTIKKSSIVFAEINLETFLSCTNTQTTYTRLSAFPTVNRDISLLVPAKTYMGDLESHMYKNTHYLKSVELFDEFYDADRLGADRKNLAFHLTFQSSKHTLSDDDVEQDFQAIVKILGDVFGAELRL